MNKKFWKNKKVLITGHTGFKGSWLSLWLQNLGANTIGYALAPPTQPNLFTIAHVADGMVSTTGDIGDLDKIQATIAEHQIEIVIHMAAQSLVHRSYIDPVETYATNIMGTVNLLEAVRRTEGVRVVLIVTSDKCYQNKEWVWGYRENEPMGGQDPYSSSKGCAELVTFAFRNSYFSDKGNFRHDVAVGSARAGNVIGGGDWAENRLMPDMIKAIMENKPMIIRSPKATRPWQHVLDPLNGYLCLIERLWESPQEFADGWNFGPDNEGTKSVSWIVENLTRLWGINDGWVLDSADYPHEAHHLKLDCSKTRSQLGWIPKISLSEALEWIVEWYQGYQQGEKMRDLTNGQIIRYENL